MESTSTRIQVWSTTWNLIQKQPLLGTGTGDVKDELIKSYRASGFNFAADHQFNAHNQFLQSWLALGIFGLFLLASLFIIPIVSFWRKKELLMIIFLVVSYFNLLVESMLEKQDGVVFFALFYSLFLLIPFEEKKHLNSVA